jgi:hypothetical protein
LIVANGVPGGGSDLGFPLPLEGVLLVIAVAPAATATVSLALAAIVVYI